MTKHATQSDMSRFEAAAIRDGARVDVVFRRRGPAILARLTPATRQAVETYIATAEAVLAGGASNPRDSLAGSAGSGGAPSGEGRQSRAVDQVRFLRRIEAAVGQVQDSDGPRAQMMIRVGRRNPVEVRALDLWRDVCLGDMSMEAFLRKRGLAPAKSRMAALNEGFMAAADRATAAIGATRSPWA